MAHLSSAEKCPSFRRWLILHGRRRVLVLTISSSAASARQTVSDNLKAGITRAQPQALGTNFVATSFPATEDHIHQVGIRENVG